MLMTIGGLIVAAILMLIAWLNESAWLKKFVLGGTAIWLAVYTVLLFGMSALSAGKSLKVNEPKAFCGFYLDCHMHAAVTGIERSKTLNGRSAEGIFYIVSVKVYSDARRAMIGLLSVEAQVEDASGHLYSRNLSAELELPLQPEFERKLGPQGSFTKRIVFDMPADVQDPKMDIREGYVIDQLIEAILIGDEDSLFHERNCFCLNEQCDPNLRAEAR